MIGGCGVSLFFPAILDDSSFESTDKPHGRVRPRRKKVSLEVKLAAVWEMIQRAQPICALAEKYQVQESVLYYWKKQLCEIVISDKEFQGLLLEMSPERGALLLSLRRLAKAVHLREIQLSIHISNADRTALVPQNSANS